MKELFYKIKESKLIKVSLIIQALIFIVLLIPSPAAKMSFRYYDLIYLIIPIAFMIKKTWRSQLWNMVLASGVLHFAFTVIYYYTKEAANVGTLLCFALVVVIPGTITFVKWVMFEVKQPNLKNDLALSLLSWGLMSLANPPFKFGFISFFVLTPWLIVLARSNRSRGYFVSYCGGILYHVINFYWLINVTKIGPPVFIILGLFLFVSFFSLFYVLMGRVFQKLQATKLIFLYPVLWAGVEVFRTKGDFSFPWNHLGYTLGGFTELIQDLSWIGVFGYSILIVFSNVLIFYWLKNNKKQFIPLVLVIPIFLFAHGSYVLDNAPNNDSIPDDKKMDIVMLQPSVIQEHKWSRVFYKTVIDNLWEMLSNVQNEFENTKDKPDLIVLPETAVPDFIKRKKEFIDFKSYSRKIGIPMIVGALNYDKDGPEGRKVRFYNSAFLFDGVKKVKEYRKIKLVPFSERIPFDDVFPILNYVDFGEGDFVPGSEIPVYDSLNFAFTPNICYESIYPSFIRKVVDKGAKIIINITNDGWFGRSAAPYHHANLVKFRSVENAISIARVANSGISVFFDDYGREFKTTHLMEKSIIRYKLPLKTRTTLYSQIGDVVEGVLFWFTLMFLVYLFWFKSFIASALITKCCNDGDDNV